MTTTERANEVQEVLRLMESGQSESAACRSVGIPRSTFRTTALRVGAGAAYAQALEGLALAQVEEIEKVLTDLAAKTIDPHSARVAIDARKWLAAKLLPGRFECKPAGPTVEIPELAEAQTAADQARAIIRAAARGEVTTDAAQALLVALAAAGKVIEVAELESRIAALEEAAHA